MGICTVYNEITRRLNKPDVTCFDRACQLLVVCETTAIAIITQPLTHFVLPFIKFYCLESIMRH